jgi:hypothetical protein
MAEILDILDAFTMPLKVTWVVWLAWGIGQIFWYRYERRPRTISSRPGAARKPFVSKPSMPQRAGTRLVTLEQVIVKETPSRGPSGMASPLLESAAALLAESSAVTELDRFVADFEMNTRHQRERPHDGKPVDAHVGS